MKISGSRAWAATAAAAALVLLSGCSQSATESADASVPAECPITVSDGWVKAADSGMTAAFGVLANTGGADVVVTSGATPVAGTVELHEVVEQDGAMVMQPVSDGFAVPAGGSVTLEPGGLHIMLMGLTAPVAAGDEVGITLTCDSGATFEYTGQAKEFTGAAEDYQGGAGMTGDKESGGMESAG